MKREMRKILFLCLIIAVGLGVSGATCKNLMCSPGANAVIQAAEMAAQIAALQTVYPLGTVVGNALTAALPNVQKLKDGYCVSDQVNFLLYVQGLIESADQAAVLTNKRAADDKPYMGLKTLGLKK